MKKTYKRSGMEGKEKFLGLEKRISGRIIVLTAVSSIFLGALGLMGSYFSSLTTLESSLNEMSSVAADRVTAEMKEYEAVAYETGSIARLADAERSVEDKQAILKQRIDDHNFTGGMILDSSGRDISDGTDYSDQEYFKQAMAGNTYTSTPVLDEETEELRLAVAAPLWEGGIPHTAVIGAVVYVPQPDFLDGIMRSIQVGKSGQAFMVDKNGGTIAHTAPGLAGREKVIEAARSEPALKGMAAIAEEMRQGKDGFGSFSYGGTNYIISYSPVPDTDGWSIGVIVKRVEFLKSFFITITLLVPFILMFLLTGLYYGKKTGKSIAAPIVQAVGRLKLLSQGDLHTEVEDVKTGDETELLMDNLRETVVRLGKVVEEIGGQAGKMSEGNFAFTIDREYAGDFAVISNSFKGIIKSLQEAFREIGNSTRQVAEGADHLSGASQALAEGAADQSSSVEELNASVTEMTEMINGNAENARRAKASVSAVNGKITESNEDMKQMMAAMERIRNTSRQIEDIVHTIEDIASQTNLLALNASIEAARAGEAGKGFAVVAGEVGSLADQSREAAQNTTQLIENAIAAVDEGTRIMDITAGSLEEVVENSAQIGRMIGEIADASEKQADAAEQISDAVNQISAVVEENSATSQESAASSQELAGESDRLKEMISRFRY